MKTFIDLFCGIGGFRLALEDMGLECVFSSEIDTKARDSYEANFGEAPAGDITQVKAEDIPAHDILCAGFPCQSFSVSGNKTGLNDKRGALFFEIVRIAEHHKPKVMLLENVRNLLKVDDGKALETIKAELDALGYDVHLSLLNASDFGIPQARVRVYFACLRRDLDMSYSEPPPDRKDIFLRDILEPDFDESLIYKGSKTPEFKPQQLSLGISADRKPVRLGSLGGTNTQGYHIYSVDGPAITQCSQSGGAGTKTGLYLTEPRHKPILAGGFPPLTLKNRKGKPSREFRQAERIFHENGHSPTMMVCNYDYYLTQGVVRKLSVLEVKRLMGFPDDHIVDPRKEQARRLLGNAVIPHMVKVVYGGITHGY